MNACEWQRGVWVELDEAKGFPATDMGLPLVSQEMHELITLQGLATAAGGVMEVVLAGDYKDCTLVTKIDATATIKYIKCFGGRLAPFTWRMQDLQTEYRRHVSLVVEQSTSSTRRCSRRWRASFARLGLTPVRRVGTRNCRGTCRTRRETEQRWGTTFCHTRC